MSGLVGVDEAGRGPALGSMFVAAVRVEDAATLPSGIADSKQLADDRRETLAARIEKTPGIAVAVREVTPAEIDGEAGRLNQLTARTCGAVIDDLLEGASRDGPICIVDACDVDEARFARRVADHAPASIRLQAEHGADAARPIVGAASIIAKSRRERHVATLAETYGNLGSGYPSDPATRSFLDAYVADHGDLPDCARRSWKPCRERLAATEQRTLDGSASSEEEDRA